MVSPVASGLQPQIPAANTFQPGGSTDNIRQKEDRQEASAATASSTSESTRSEPKTETRSTPVSASSREEDNGAARTRADRGSVLDVVV